MKLHDLFKKVIFPVFPLLKTTIVEDDVDEENCIYLIYENKAVMFSRRPDEVSVAVYYVLGKNEVYRRYLLPDLIPGVPWRVLCPRWEYLIPRDSKLDFQELYIFCIAGELDKKCEKKYPGCAHILSEGFILDLPLKGGIEKFILKIVQRSGF